MGKSTKTNRNTQDNNSGFAYVIELIMTEGRSIHCCCKLHFVAFDLMTRKQSTNEIQISWQVRFAHVPNLPRDSDPWNEGLGVRLRYGR